MSEPIVVTTVPLAHALWPVPEKRLGYPMRWLPDASYLQQLVVRLKAKSLLLAACLDEEQMAAVASNICAEVNAFLKAQGFNIQLKDLGSMNMLYVAAVMKLCGYFETPGVTGYHLKKIARPGFRLRGHILEHYQYGAQHVVSVATTGGFNMLITSPIAAQGFEKLEAWEEIRGAMRRTSGNGLVLPMADIGETEVDVEDLVGMVTINNWRIMEALMATKFKLTPDMVSMEAAFAYSMAKGCIMMEEGREPEANDYVADHDLEIALVHPNEKLTLLPFGAAYVPANRLALSTVS